MMDKNLGRETLKKRKNEIFPARKVDQELMMFKEIFIKPITQAKDEDNNEQLVSDEFQERLNYEKKQAVEKHLQHMDQAQKEMLDHSNMMNESIHEIKKARSTFFLKNKGVTEKEQDGDLNLLDLMKNEALSAVLKKFASSKNKSSSFFVQQIHVQPPDGINATVAAPLTPGGGWAPSIPNPNFAASTSNSLQDMTIRARAGVQAGDVQKEAHMAYSLAKLNEDKKKYKTAIRFYKDFFFYARLLEDPIGSALAFNRIGVAYHKLRQYNKSLSFHKKHMEFSDTENIFASHYNSGICHRFLNNNEDSIVEFTKAMEWASQRGDFPSECLSAGQLGIAYVIAGDADKANENFRQCLSISRQMKNQRLQLDCLLCLGHIAYEQQDWETAMDAFKQSYDRAKVIKDKEIAEECLCNIGIMKSKEKVFDKVQSNSEVIIGFDSDCEDDEDEEAIE